MSDICIGLDQSYTDTGIAVVQDGKVLFAGHENFEGCKLRYDKRKRLIKRLEKLICHLGRMQAYLI